MIIDEQFLQTIMYDSTLNKTQFELLKCDSQHAEEWQKKLLGKKIPQDTANLLILLRGKLALKGQEVIVKNYQLMLDFNKPTPKKETKKEISNNSDTLHIYCDGACSGNPGKAGSGLAVYDGTDLPTLLFGRYEAMGTNNSAELNALYKALSIAADSICKEIIIFSDSKYSIDCITKWAYSWKSKGWTKKGGEIKNLDVIKRSHKLYEDIKNKIEIRHVKGHAGIEGNELADRMAMYTIVSKNKEYKNYSYKNTEDVLRLKRG